jgi:ABC-type transport system substrate-binding protein
VSTCRVRVLLVALAAGLGLAGCGAGGEGGTAATSSAPSAAASPEPSAAVAAAEAEAAADPATVTTPAEAALATALRAADLPAGWSVQANPVPDGDLSDDPSLAGICGGAATAESHRTAKSPVVGVDPTGSPAVSSEAIAYDTAGNAALALRELGTAFASCPPGDYTFLPGLTTTGLTADALVLQYRLADGVSQVVVTQVRGALLSVLIGEDPDATLTAAQRIAGRMGQLPAPVIGA